MQAAAIPEGKCDPRKTTGDIGRQIPPRPRHWSRPVNFRAIMWSFRWFRSLRAVKPGLPRILTDCEV